MFFLGELAGVIVHLCFSGLVGWSVLCTCVFLGELAGAYCAPVFFWVSWLE